MEDRDLQGAGAKHSASSELARVLIHRAAELGVCERALSQALGDSAAATKRDRVPIADVRRLWRTASALSGRPAFGLRVAERSPVGDLDLLDYLVRSSATWGDAIRRLIRFAPLVADAHRLSAEVGPRRVTLRHQADNGSVEFAEFVLGLVLLRSRQFSSEPIRPTSVRFAQRDQPASEFERVFDAPVTFEAPYDEMVFDRALIELPFHTAEPRLCGILESVAEAKLCDLADAGYPVFDAPAEPTVSDASFVALARAALLACLEAGNANIDRVAERLGMSQRSLQRQLRRANTSHRQLLEQARAEQLSRFTEHPGASRQELAKALAYSCTRSVMRRQRESAKPRPL
jgi:AraC-like DNA-binding protein